MSVNGNWNHNEKWHIWRTSVCDTVISHLQPQPKQQHAGREMQHSSARNSSNATIFEWNEIYLKLLWLGSRQTRVFHIKFCGIFPFRAHWILFSCLVPTLSFNIYRTLHVVYLSIIDAKRLLPLFVLRIKFKWNMCLWYVRQGGIEYRTRNMARCVHRHEHGHHAMEREYREACESEQTACHCQHWKLYFCPTVWCHNWRPQPFMDAPSIWIPWLAPYAQERTLFILALLQRMTWECDGGGNDDGDSA